MYCKGKRRISKKVPALLTAMVMTVSMTACGSGSESTETQEKNTKTESTAESTNTPTTSNEGISADSPYKDKGFDFSKHEDIELYAVGERPQDMDMVLDKVNKDYLEPWLNSTLHVEFISWGDLQTKYSLLLSGGDKCDLIYTSSWCNYNSEVGNGAFMELTPEFLQTYMPYSYEQQAPESWEQISISGKIYAVPKNFSTFTNYNVMVVRKDLLEKTGIAEINSWDTMKQALYAIADNEAQNGIYASGQRGSNEFSDHLWWQNVGAETLASGTDFMYYFHGEEKLPDWDTDVFYRYLSPDCLKMYLEMAEMASHNVWSPTRSNDTSDPQVNFESGKSASLIWNSAAVSSGEKMEKGGIGTFEVFDVTPNAHVQRDSYANDAMAIPANCEDPERTALVLDCMKGFPEVNNLLLGGIEGVHYKLTDDGKRIAGDSASAYPWGCWAWGIPGKDVPAEYTEDPRSSYFGEICEAKEYTPQACGFSFDSQPVETEMAVINSLIEEYGSSFNLGLFGDDTESKYNEFVGKLKDAGIDKVIEECKKQYLEYCSTKQS